MRCTRKCSDGRQVYRCSILFLVFLSDIHCPMADIFSNMSVCTGSKVREVGTVSRKRQRRERRFIFYPRTPQFSLPKQEVYVGRILFENGEMLSKILISTYAGLCYFSAWNNPITATIATNTHTSVHARVRTHVHTYTHPPCLPNSYLAFRVFCFFFPEPQA